MAEKKIVESLEQIYSGRFFRSRHKLHWRAEHVCNGIIKVLNPKSVVDVGCADGDLVAKFNELGIESYGIEGSKEAAHYAVTNMIYYDDLRKPMMTDFIQIRCPIDLCTCFEVAEHIEPEFADQFVNNLCRMSNNVLISAAPPGQEGHHHVNCQPYQYWIDKFAERNYYPIVNVVERIKKEWEPWRKKDGIRAFYNNLLYFTKVTTNEC